MPAVKKNKEIKIAASARTTPLLLPRNPREAKKLSEVNALLEKAILLPHGKNKK